VPWHHFARLSLEQSQLAVRSPFLDTDLVALLYRAPGGRPMDNAAILRLVARGNADLAALPTDRGDALPPSPIGTMRRSFRSLEIRAEYAFDYGMPQWLARINRALAPLRVENAFLGRHKFYHFRVWYRDQLHGYARDVLLEPRARHRSVFTAPALERMLAAHATGAGNWTREITRALTLELTYRTLIDR
jgi:asparagine synthase (glutamine-hydrolysing)